MDNWTRWLFNYLSSMAFRAGEFCLRHNKFQSYEQIPSVTNYNRNPFPFGNGIFLCYSEFKYLHSVIGNIHKNPCNACHVLPLQYCQSQMAYVFKWHWSYCKFIWALFKASIHFNFNLMTSCWPKSKYCKFISCVI